MAVIDGTIQSLRRHRQVGQSTVFISTDGSGTELRLRKELDEHFGSPGEIHVLITEDDFSGVESVPRGQDDVELAAEVAEDVSLEEE